MSIDLKLPWVVEHSTSPFQNYVATVDASRGTVMHNDYDPQNQSEEHQREIVRRVNAHDRLVEALRALEEAVSSDPDHAEGLPLLYRAAVNKARDTLEELE